MKGVILKVIVSTSNQVVWQEKQESKKVTGSLSQSGLYGKRRQQSGFSLVEVSIVTALMVILSIIGVPALQTYVIENKVPKVATDMQRFVSRMKVAAIGGGATPYAGIDQRALVNGMRDGSVVSVRGASPTADVAHGIGGQGKGENGTIMVQSDTVPGQSQGSAFRLTLAHVNHAACPMLMTAMQRMASVIKVSGNGGLVEVKNAFLSPPMQYQPVLADSQCAPGDSNRFVFTFQ